MPQRQAGKKALKQTARKTAHNLQIKKKIEFLTRQIQKAMTGKEMEQVAKIYKDLQKAIDKATKRNVLHRNTAARTKSRLTKKIKALKK